MWTDIWSFACLLGTQKQGQRKHQKKPQKSRRGDLVGELPVSGLDGTIESSFGYPA